ncbi:MAG: energy transducer TonB [Hyphomicrobiales bacterium]|nr:energy transducer TonB [Hyphomicrobiales bacterium]
MTSLIDFSELRRWVLCAIAILLAHAGLATAMVTWHEPVEGMGAAAGIVVELAPVPVAPATFQSELPPAPQEELNNSSESAAVDSTKESEKSEKIVEAKVQLKVEEKTETKPTEEPPLTVAPAPNPELAIETPALQEVQQEAPRPQMPSLAAVATAPDVIAEETAAVPAAPRQGPPNPIDREMARSWHSQISALIQSKKRYPASARARGEHGVTQVAFSVDRDGRVLEAKIVRASGIAVLDEEALAVVRRSQPFPKPPQVVPGDRFDFSFPMSFNIK